LKPENLLYENLAEDSKLKISDFGLSSILSPEVDMTSVCGAPGYTAPEILKGERFGKPGDMWSLGVICYILLCGSEPFSDENPRELFKRIIKGQYEFASPDWDKIGENAKDFVRKLIVLDPKRRLTAEAAGKNCWVNRYAAKTENLEEVVQKIKEFNDRRKQKVHEQHFDVMCTHPERNHRMLKFVGHNDT
jgi:calcium/calmodulin-dependent protein kinase-4